MTTSEANQISERLVTKYGMKIPRDVALSILMGKPNVPMLLSRASFRRDVDVRTEQRTRFQRERRQFFHTMLGLVGASAIGLISLKMATTPNIAQPVLTTYVQNAVIQNGVTQNAVTHTSQLLANASSLPLNQALTFNDPTLGPGILIHLNNGRFVAYSDICTHAGCQVQFNPSGNDLVCPCHGALYDPYNNAQVLAGPAPYPLQSIPIQYDQATGNIYLTG